MSVQYRYRAATASGQVVEGVMQAPSRQTVVDGLRRQQLFPVTVDEAVVINVAKSGKRLGRGAVLDDGLRGQHLIEIERLGLRNWFRFGGALVCRFLDELECRFRRAFFAEFLRDDILQLDHFGFRWRGRRSGFVEINLRESKLRNFGGFGNWRWLGNRCRLRVERRSGFFGNHELSRRLGSSFR